jgi:predicted N-acetyltransferase YhbS
VRYKRKVEKIIKLKQSSLFDYEKKFKIVLLIDYWNPSNWEKIHTFNCNNQSMNSYLTQEAYYNSIEFIANTSLVLNEENDLVGYFTLVQNNINFPSGPIPCLEVARLAVSHNHQKKGIGSYILKQIVQSGIQTNNRYITLDAISSEIDWYLKRNFIPFKSEEMMSSLLVYMYCDLYDEDLVESFLDE